MNKNIQYEFTDEQMFEKLTALGVDVETISNIYQLATNSIGVRFNTGVIKTFNVPPNK